MEDDGTNTQVLPEVSIIEFLEVAVHQLLYIHQIYPSGIFTRKQKYGVPVQVSSHPLVNSYITQCLKTALELIKLQTLSNVMLIFCVNDKYPVKKIIFDVLSLQRRQNIAGHEVLQLESAFRDMLLRLTVSDRLLKPLPKDCTFKIMLSTQEKGHIALSKNPELLANQDFPWTRSSDYTVVDAHVVPLSACDSCGVLIQVYAEETDLTSFNLENETPIRIT